MAISAQQVKELRDMTGAGMMDCKKALEACNGDVDASIDWLREKGKAKAQKKANRIAAEGLTSFVIEGNSAAIVEVNSETDFVAKNKEFIQLTNYIAKLIVSEKPADLEAALKLEKDGNTIESTIAEATGKIGEKITLRRFVVMEKKDDEVFGAYSHMGGKITSLVKIADSDEVKAKDIAMHVAASAPQYIDRTAIPADVLDKETSILKAQALEENSQLAKPKPDNIIEKMVQGRLNKNLKEMCLVDQEFVKDPDQTVAQYLGKGKVLEMARFMVGEGLAKREDNFAEEVTKSLKG